GRRGAQAVVERDGALGLIAFGGGDVAAELARVHAELRVTVRALRKLLRAADGENRDEEQREPRAELLPDDVRLLAATRAHGPHRVYVAVSGDDRARAEEQDESAMSPDHAVRIGPSQVRKSEKRLSRATQ